MKNFPSKNLNTEKTQIACYERAYKAAKIGLGGSQYPVSHDKQKACHAHHVSLLSEVCDWPPLTSLMNELQSAVVALFANATDGFGVHVTVDPDDPQMLFGFDGPAFHILSSDPILEHPELIREWVLAEKAEHEATAAFCKDHPWNPIFFVHVWHDSGDGKVKASVYTRITTSQDFVHPLTPNLRELYIASTAALAKVRNQCTSSASNRCNLEAQ